MSVPLLQSAIQSYTERDITENYWWETWTIKSAATKEDLRKSWGTKDCEWWMTMGRDWLTRVQWTILSLDEAFFPTQAHPESNLEITWSENREPDWLHAKIKQVQKIGPIYRSHVVPSVGFSNETEVKDNIDAASETSDSVAYSAAVVRDKTK